MSATLLIEVLTEELPPKALEKLSAAFTGSIVATLQQQGYCSAGAAVSSYATPRRLAVAVAEVVPVQTPRHIERKGPAVAAAMKNGEPTAALAGFARSCGVAVDQLEIVHDGKQDCYAFRSVQPGAALAQHLPEIVTEALIKLPTPKRMRWGDGEVEFVRPLHGLVMLHGADVIPGSVLGLDSGNTTLGHRFLSSGAIVIRHADEYAATMRDQGRIMPDYASRRAAIRDQLTVAAGDAKVLWDEALLDEVTALVEYPSVYAGTFSADFLEVPAECLVLSMKQHQKYFPLADAAGNLLPRFLLVSNLQTGDPAAIIHGNERVLRARLSDARFFFEQDRKTLLEDRVGKLAHVVYHNKLGTQLERVERLRRTAATIAGLLQADSTMAERAAYLAKADLLTDMVGEFPELQGLMGERYAILDGEVAEVAAAISAHYRPRFAGDALPQGAIAISVALADKLDTLIGIYGIGAIPTGDKDPFALRRAALGVLRILIETPLALSLPVLLEHAQAAFSGTAVAGGTDSDVYAFLLERLRSYLKEQGYDALEIEAVLIGRPERMDLMLARIRAVHQFRQLPDADALSAANKRVQNILKKVTGPLTVVNPELFVHDAERLLFERVVQLTPRVSAMVEAGEYAEALTAMAAVRPEVDGFFDSVMVMADDIAVRQNRLALLHALGELMNQVADISLLS
ncbi:MAG TPA: glycine--tRNA ligase subunit beta [Burkholderiales bacterium]|nr:glycine--tRNA ligase subunit beta [Burkholderiales bacterium]